MAGMLAGRIALVTGAGSGIGKAVSQLFAREGAVIVGVDLHVKNLINELPTESEDQQQHTTHEVDVSSETSIANMMKDVYKHYQQVPSICVNCAGISGIASFLAKMSENDFDQVLNVNLKGTFLTTKHLCGMLMKKKVTNASIINIASIIGKTGSIGQANYTASKAGVIALTKTTALEFARYGIRCNVVLPGFIQTAMTEKIPAKIQDVVLTKIPLQRFGEPEDIAQACLFLASDQSKYITAASIEVTGGLDA